MQAVFKSVTEMYAQENWNQGIDLEWHVHKC